MKSFFNLSIFILLLSSCTATYNLNVRRPAMYNLTPDLDTVVIINRTKIEKGNGKQVLNVLEGVLSGEPILGDRYGTKEALRNLEQLLYHSDRLTLSGNGIIDMTKPSISDNQPPLSHKVIDSICKLYGVDGVIALEYFDSNSFYSNASSNVRTFWRVYTANETNPIIETRILSSGYAYTNYYSMVPPEYTSIARAGAHGSAIFYDQIVPPIFREPRYYYTGGSKEMKLGKKAFRSHNIDQAIYYWETEAESLTNTKIAARAAFNIALAYEIKGDINKAIEWADASIANGNQKAIQYKGILIGIQQQLPIVDHQMERK